MSDIWQLGIESSAPVASLVILNNGQVLDQRVVKAAQNHSAVLIEPLAELLKALPSKAVLQEVVVATGPGSYNGARVGIAAGQGIALIHGCPTIGIPSLEALPEVRAGGSCLAVGDARRGSFFTIRLVDGSVQGEPEIMSHEELVERITAATEAENWLFSFEATDRLNLPEALEGKISVATPEARLVVEAWEAKSTAEKEMLRQTPPQPFYLRPPHITQSKKAR